MGNLVADALLDRTKGQGVTAVITNGGGLRASINAGPVSMGEVITVLPFQNTVSTFGLKGSDIVAALENGLSEIEDGAGRFPQVAGMKFTFDTSKPAGHRVVAVQMQEGNTFVPLDSAKVYTLASNNYMRAGGDGYEIFAKAAVNPYDFGPTLDEVLADYLAAHRPYKPYTDGRIAAVAAPATAPAAPDTATAPTTATPAAAPAPSTASRHVIVRGDTLWDLAEDAYGDGFQWRKISEANGNPEPRALAIGSELEVPAQ